MVSAGVIIAIVICCVLVIVGTVLGVYFSGVACPDFGSECKPSPAPGPAMATPGPGTATPGPAPRTPGPAPRTPGPAPRTPRTPGSPLGSLSSTPDAAATPANMGSPPPPPPPPPPPAGTPFTCSAITCQNNEYMSGTCNQTTKTDTRQCLNCPENSSPKADKTACVCNSGFMKAYNLSFNDQAGLKCTALSPGTTLDNYGRVTCVSPYVMSSTGCVIPPTTCPVGYELRDNFPVCQMCDMGKYKNDTGISCKTCPDGTTNGFRGSTSCPINIAPPAPDFGFGFIPPPTISEGGWPVDSSPPEPVYAREMGD